MLSSSSSLPSFRDSLPTIASQQRASHGHRSGVRTLCRERTTWVVSPAPLFNKTVPLAASLSLLLWSTPVNAGILSGFSGLESVPTPQLPQFDFLTRWNEENQKKYAELDSKFKSSKVLKELLEKSKLNKERNQRETQDKYCIRGAEWGVGDCSTQGMTQEERDEFIATLKRKTSGE